jgi:hypothetical protein
MKKYRVWDEVGKREGLEYVVGNRIYRIAILDVNLKPLRN